MKVEINTKDRSVYVSANDIAHSLEAMDKWIKALKVARGWLQKELASDVTIKPKGFFDGLSAQQKEAALAYRGEDA